MGVNVISIFLVLWVSAVVAQPLNSHYLPKEYYQRQNLPEIPGYIPVYIKHDDEALPKWKGDNRETEAKGEDHSVKAENQAEKEPQPQQPVETKRTNTLTENLQNSSINQNKDQESAKKI